MSRAVNDECEPMLRLNASRKYILFPIEKSNLWALYKQAEASIWHTPEVDLSRDAEDWKRLGNGERKLLVRILAFFAASDLIVNENLARRFSDEVQWPEARCFYYLQMFVESVHSETYSLLIDTYVEDRVERDALFHAIENVPTIRKKADWALRWIDGGCFAERLLAFAIVEGLFFSASFCAIFWFKKRGLLPGLCFANELIMRDEGLHTRFACALYAELERPLDVTSVHGMVSEAVEIEKAFVHDSLPVDLLGMNGSLMGDYIEFVADVLLGMVKAPPLYKTTNPFEFMDMQSLSGKTNFFERRVGEYQRAGVLRSDMTHELDMDCAF